MTAREFARTAHDSIGQVRKFSGKPYWTHTQRVANRVAFFKGTPQMIDAAELHDTLEDVAPEQPAFGLDRIEIEFGPIVAKYVVDMTDVFTKASFPAANRATRQEWEARRLALVSDEVKIIKLSDRWDNTLDIPRDGFGFKYAKETKRLLESLVIPSGSWKRAADIMIREIEDLIA